MTSTSRRLAVEVVVSPFGADVPAMVEVARGAEDSGLRAVWTFDHLTGSMIGRPWSHDPFVVLGAMAGATERIGVGPLVANMMNRHPVQLALALASLQSLSGGRALLGVGAGATPGSSWAVEHEAIGTGLEADGAVRRRRLAETIEVVGSLWQGAQDHAGEFFRVDGIGEVVGPTARPPVVVGAASAATVDVAMAWADGVNLLPVPHRPALVERVLAARDRGVLREGFTVSLYTDLDTLAEATRGLSDEVLGSGLVTGLVVAVRPPFDLAAVSRLGSGRWS